VFHVVCHQLLVNKRFICKQYLHLLFCNLRCCELNATAEQVRRDWYVVSGSRWLAEFGVTQTPTFTHYKSRSAVPCELGCVFSRAVENLPTAVQCKRAFTAITIVHMVVWVRNGDRSFF